MLELYEYERPVLTGGTVCGRRGLGAVSEVAQRENRATVAFRARETIRRLVEANRGQYHDANGEVYKPVFATFTFAENVTDLDRANSDWTRFIKRLTYQVTGQKRATFKYLTVVEFQKRGAIHYHTIFFNLPFIPARELAAIWGQGFIKINAIDQVDHVGAYVCKYIGKGQGDDRLIGEKSYFTSRGLHHPVDVKEKDQVDAVAAALLPGQTPSRERTWDSEHHGRVRYRQFNLR